MPEAPDGRVDVVDRRYVIRFERFFANPVEQVWAAITEPERLKEWVGATDIEIELLAGGKMVTRTTEPPELVAAIIAEAGEEALESHDTVLYVEPPRVFEHTFGGYPDSIVRWELGARGRRLSITAHAHGAGGLRRPGRPSRHGRLARTAGPAGSESAGQS